MIICISGLTGSGKNTVSELVAQKLGLRLVSPTFKTLAAKHKMSLMDFHKKAEREHSIDKRFDAQLLAQAKKGNCVVSTWLGPWIVKDANLRVWLYAKKEARAARIAKRDAMPLEEAERHVLERDESNHLRYREIYGIDIYDHTDFDILINTERFSPQQSSEIIVAAAKQLGFAAKSGKEKAGAKRKKKR
ncbi:MAG: cytidylate kinase family protein [Candidatus Anstonellaceae archaeon]